MLISGIMPISRQYRADRILEHPSIKGAILTYTMAGRYKSLEGKLYAQVFINDYFFAAAYSMYKKSIVWQGLSELIYNYVVMDRLVCDGSKYQTAKGADFMK